MKKYTAFKNTHGFVIIPGDGEHEIHAPLGLVDWNPPAGFRHMAETLGKTTTEIVVAFHTGRQMELVLPHDSTVYAGNPPQYIRAASRSKWDTRQGWVKGGEILPSLETVQVAHATWDDDGISLGGERRENPARFVKYAPISWLKEWATEVGVIPLFV